MTTKTCYFALVVSKLIPSNLKNHQHSMFRITSLFVVVVGTCHVTWHMKFSLLEQFVQQKLEVQVLSIVTSASMNNPQIVSCDGCFEDLVELSSSRP